MTKAEAIASGATNAERLLRLNTARAIATIGETANIAAVGTLQSMTLGHWRSKSDIYKKMTGMPVSDGKGGYKFIDAMSREEAEREVLTDQAIEYASEGTSDMIERPFAGLVESTAGQKFLKLPVVRQLYKSQKAIYKATGGKMGGMFGEYGEELVGNSARVAFGIMDAKNEEGTGAYDTKQNVETFLHLMSGMLGQRAVVSAGTSGFYGIKDRWVMRKAQKASDNAFIDHVLASNRTAEGNNVKEKNARKQAKTVLKEVKKAIAAEDYSAASEIIDRDIIIGGRNLSNEQKAQLLHSAGLYAVNKKSVSTVADDIVNKRLTGSESLATLSRAGMSITKVDPAKSHEGNKNVREVVYNGTSGKPGKTGIFMDIKTGNITDIDGKTDTKEARRARNKYDAASIRSSNDNVSRFEGDKSYDALGAMQSEATMYYHLAKTGRLARVLERIEDKAVLKDVKGTNFDVKLAKLVHSYQKNEGALLSQMIGSDKAKNMSSYDKANIISALAFNEINSEMVASKKNNLKSEIVKALSEATNVKESRGQLLEAAETMIKSLGLKVDIKDSKTIQRLATLMMYHAVENLGDNKYNHENSTDAVGKYMILHKKSLRNSVMETLQAEKDLDLLKLSKSLYESGDNNVAGEDEADLFLSAITDEAILSGEMDESGIISSKMLADKGIFTLKNLKGNKNNSKKDSVADVFAKYGIETDIDIEDFENKIIASIGKKKFIAANLKKAIASIGNENLTNAISSNKALISDILASIEEINKLFNVESNAEGKLNRSRKDVLSNSELEHMMNALRKYDMFREEEDLDKEDDEEFENPPLYSDENNPTEDEIAKLFSVDVKYVTISNFENAESVSTVTTGKIDLPSGLSYTFSYETKLVDENREVVSSTLELDRRNIDFGKLSESILSGIVNAQKSIPGINNGILLINENSIVDMSVTITDNQINVKFEYKYSDGTKSTHSFMFDATPSVTESTFNKAIEPIIKAIHTKESLLNKDDNKPVKDRRTRSSY